MRTNNNILYSYLLVALSAVTGVTAFIFPQYCWWLVFVFLIPLFVAVQKTTLTAVQGFLWGLIFFGLHFATVIPLLVRMIGGWLPIFGYLAVVGYFSLLSAAWFWLANLFTSSTKISPTFSFFIATWLFFVFIHHACLLPFCGWEGFLVVSPLVPLAQVPETLWLLPGEIKRSLIITLAGGGSGLLLLALVGGSAGASVVFNKQSRDPALLDQELGLGDWPSTGWALIWYSVFIVGFFEQPQQVNPSIDLAQVGYISAKPWPHCNPTEVAQNIAERVRALTQKHPEVSLIVMPESTCCFPVNSSPHASEILMQEIGRDHALLFGGHREIAGELANCLYFCSNLLITECYAKAKLIPFVEYVPSPFNKFGWIKNIFLNGHKEFRESGITNRYPICTFSWPANGTLQVIPQICWELYVAPKDPGGGVSRFIPILALVNDSWYLPYMQKLLFLAARFQAIKWQRPMLYVSHTGAWWLNGNEMKVIKA